MGRGLIDGFAGGYAVAGEPTAAQAEDGRGRQRAGQDGERKSAAMTNAASNPDEVVEVVVRLSEATTVADYRVVSAHRAAARKQAQRNYPGSTLFSVSGNAIKRITAGVKARRDRSRQDLICWPGLHPPG